MKKKVIFDKMKTCVCDIEEMGRDCWVRVGSMSAANPEAKSTFECTPSGQQDPEKEMLTTIEVQ